MTKTNISISLALAFAALVSGCAVVPLEAPAVPVASPLPMPVSTFRDTTVVQPNIYFEETPQSRAVIVGSALYARVNACSLIQRYRIRTNVDFTSSMNLFKYRAHQMGAKWVAIVHHAELDKHESSLAGAGGELIIREGTDLGSARYLTSLTGDLYDCPCTTTSCSGR